MSMRVLIVVILAVLSGGVAWAATSGGGQDPAPPSATQDKPGVVSLARPITPIALDTDPPSAIEMRITEPAGARRVVAVFRETRTSTGRKVDRVCLAPGPERALRKYRMIRGNCLDRASGQPWMITTGSGTNAPTSIAGIASEQVTRLTIAGPGGTFVVPRSRSGAFLIAYDQKLDGRAVLTATLKDGTTRFFRTELPPVFRDPTALVVPDPGDLPDWSISAGLRDRGPRIGETCAQVRQDLELRAKNRRRRGGNATAPVCGDLRTQPFYAWTVQLRPTATRTPTFGLGRNSARRTILAGAVTKAVRSVAVLTPMGRQELALSEPNRAFLAVYPPAVKPAQLTLEITTTDGKVQRFPNPVAVNRSRAEHPAPRLIGKVKLRTSPPGSRRVVLRAVFDGPARRAEITFRGREVRLRRAGGTSRRAVYVGVYDGNRGARKPLPIGKVLPFFVIRCGDSCATELQRARLR